MFPLEPNSVNTVITSPPYWDQRAYTGAIGQIGNEEDVDEYIENIAEVSNNIWNVLKNDGSYFLNIGDKYIDKSLGLIPYRVAERLRKDGWILRNVIAWVKINAMPYAGKDRLRNSYEPVFHFVKKDKYYYDIDAIRMPHQTLTIAKIKDSKMAKEKLGIDIKVSSMSGLFDIGDDVTKTGYADSKVNGEDMKNIGARGGFAKNGETVENRYADGGRNPGDVFVEDTQPKWEFDCACGKTNYFDLNDIFIDEPDDTWFLNIEQSKVNHTATFPKKLVEKMILATTRIGDVVLDPFCGSGTTNIVAESLNRNSIGFDLAYSDAREQRLQENIEKSIF
jgi:DNA modification methylase